MTTENLESRAEAFRAETRQWLAENAPAFVEPIGTRREGEFGNLDAVRAWQARKAEGRFVGMALPPEFGGRGAGGLEVAIFAAEEQRYNLPSNMLLPSQHDILMPVLVEFLAPEVAHELIPPMLRADVIWCQLFSEPGAGSDIAGVATRAVRDGDGWVINGQKTWNSAAKFARWGFLIARTDPNVPKHKGLSCFRVPMEAPGVSVRPIRQITGHTDFCDVFFDDVRLPADAIIGKPGDGWKIVMSCLRIERQVAASLPAFEADPFGAVFDIARRRSTDGERPLDSSDVRAKLASWYVSGEGMRNMRSAILGGLSAGREPGPESSAFKLQLGARQTELLTFAMELAGEGGIVGDETISPELARIQEDLLFSYGMRVGGGTEDILRNILGEYVLGLPGDPRADKDMSFAELQAAQAKSQRR